MKHTLSSFFFILLFTAYIIPQNINLRDTTNQFDYIIITVPEFVQACQTFKQHKGNVRGFNVLLVDTTQIYSQFNSDTTGEDNIRDFISYAGTYWKNPKPKYILLVGDRSKVPSFPFTYLYLYVSGTDYFYSQNIYDPDTTYQDFEVGRIPARTAQEITNYFNKVINYESSTDSILNNNSILWCEHDLQFQFELTANQLSEQFPSYINPTIFSSDTNLSDSGNKDSIINHVNNYGISTLWFWGHCADSDFVSNEFFNLNDVSSFINQNNYFISLFLGFQELTDDSTTNLQNEMLLSPSASLGGIAPVGPIFYPAIVFYYDSIATLLFSNNISLGNVVNVNYASSDSYMRKILNLWGDPSIVLRYSTVTQVRENNKKAKLNYALEQNYPNPFNPTTTIEYRLPQKGLVTLKIYNILGQEVKTLVNRFENEGKHQVKFDAVDLPSGVYFYRIEAGNFVQTKKLILLK